MQISQTMSHTVLISFTLGFVFAFSAVCAQAPAPALAPTPSLLPGAPAPALDCFNTLLNVSDCLTYVEAGSNQSKPEPNCCPSFAGLVESAPICLCQLLGSSSSFGIQIDLNKAMKLPQVCSVATPPVSLCSAVGIPVSSPTSSEGPGMSGGLVPTNAPITPDSGTPSGNKALSAKNFSFYILLGLSSVVMLTLF